jgi:signal transduction histidine kinase
VKSLRIQLFAWVFALYLLTAGAALLNSYRQFDAGVNRGFDGQMRELARSYTKQISLSGAVAPLRPVSDNAIRLRGANIVQFWARDGRLQSASRALPGLGLQRGDGFHTVNIGRESWRVYTAHAEPISVQIAASNNFRRRVIWDSAWYSAEPILLLIPLTAALLWVAIFVALRPLSRLTEALRGQDERALTQLSTRKVPTELIPLITSMNGLLERLRSAFESQDRFIQEAAHQLRTPVTAVKLQLENLRRRSGASAITALADLETGIQRLQRLVEQLLTLARQQDARVRAPMLAVDLLPILKQSIADIAPLAERREIDLGLERADSASIRTDSDHLRTVLDNVLDNAVRYTPAGGRVDVSLRRTDDQAVVEIGDSGPGIPADQLERVFERFYRIPTASAQGSGLGLAIARAAALRAQASIELANRTDRSGLMARIRIPLAS